MPYCDVIIVGAGPAGASAAYFLARAGFEVVVLEREFPGRDKPCGEGVQAPGLSVLQGMNILVDACEQGKLFGQLHFHNRERRFSLPLAGLAIARRRFDSLLIDAAIKAGAMVAWRQTPLSLSRDHGHWCVETAAERWYGHWIVGADGAQSWVRRRLGVRTVSEGDRAGLVFHAPATADDAYSGVHIYPHAEGEIYTVPVDEQVRLVAWLGATAGLQGDRAAFAAALSSSLRQGGIDVDLPAMAGRAVAPLMYRSLETAGPGWWLLGDAAAQTDPITGLGVSNALVGASVAARHIAQSLAGSNKTPMAHGVRSQNERHHAASRIARGIHFFLKRPGLWRYLDEILKGVPDLPDTVVKTLCPDDLEFNHALPNVYTLLARHAGAREGDLPSQE